VPTAVPGSPVAPSSPHSKSSTGSSAEDLKPVNSKIIRVRDAPKEDKIFAYLPKHEQDVLNAQVEVLPIPVKYTTLYTYTTI